MFFLFFVALILILHILIVAAFTLSKLEKNFSFTLFHFLVLFHFSKQSYDSLKFSLFQGILEGCQIVKIPSRASTSENINDSTRSTHPRCSSSELEQLTVSSWCEAHNDNISSKLVDGISGWIINTNTSFLQGKVNFVQAIVASTEACRS